jgi:ESCRT-II complex subunit VPS22
MRRRGVGIASIKKKDELSSTLSGVAKDLEASELEHITKQMLIFKDKLESFAQKHKDKINSNPVFRMQFQKMSTSIGVDPLASSKGFWAQTLGLGDFYYELAIQMIEVCLRTRHRNGGMISMEELLSSLRTKRGKKASEISEDDIKFAISKVAELGNGFRLVKLGQKSVIISVPMELNKDHTDIINLASSTGYVSASSVKAVTGWTSERISGAIHALIKDGMVWVDSQAKDAGEDLFWFPSLWNSSASSSLLPSSSSLSSSSSSSLS